MEDFEINVSETNISDKHIIDYWAMSDSKRYNIIYYHYQQKGWFIGQTPLGKQIVFKPIGSLKYLSLKFDIRFKNQEYLKAYEKEELTPFIDLWRVKVPVDISKINSPLALIEADTIVLHYNTFPTFSDVEKDFEKIFKDTVNIVYSDIKYSFLKSFMPKLVTYMPILLIGKGNEKTIEADIASNIKNINDNFENMIYILRLTAGQKRSFVNFHYKNNEERIDYTHPFENYLIGIENSDEFVSIEKEINVDPIPYIEKTLKARYNFYKYINDLVEKDKSNVEKWNKIAEVYDYLVKSFTTGK